MVYNQVQPYSSLTSIIECYWIVENNDPAVRREKIIPDGYPEIIFHFADYYKIKIGKNWELQSKNLLAGQITKHFFLENTGRSGMIGIKLLPTAVTRLYGISMNRLTDKVIDLEKIAVSKTEKLTEQLWSLQTHEEKNCIPE